MSPSCVCVARRSACASVSQSGGGSYRELQITICFVYRTDSAASEGSATQHETPTKLKRARLADNLNEKIALRPGPLELVEKNIIPADSTVKEAAMRGISWRNEKWRNDFQLH